MSQFYKLLAKMEDLVQGDMAKESLVFAENQYMNDTDFIEEPEKHPPRSILIKCESYGDGLKPLSSCPIGEDYCVSHSGDNICGGVQIAFINQKEVYCVE